MDFRERVRPFHSAAPVEGMPRGDMDGLLVERVVPFASVPGCVVLTEKRVYFQPAQVNNVGEACQSCALSRRTLIL